MGVLGRLRAHFKLTSTQLLNQASKFTTQAPWQDTTPAPVNLRSTLVLLKALLRNHKTPKLNYYCLLLKSVLS